MKKMLLWMVSAALCAGLIGCGASAPEPSDASIPTDGETVVREDSAARAATEAEAAYEETFNELEAESPDAELHRVVFPCGTGEDILVVTSSVYGDGETMEADVYQYADGEVHFLTTVSSTGSAYPLAFTEEAVLFGGNHTAGKLVIHEGTGELYQLLNMNIEGKTAVLETYDVADGELTLKSSEELSPEDADLYDYYTNAFAEETAEVIGFE